MPTLLGLIARARLNASPIDLLNLHNLPLPSPGREFNLVRGVGWGLYLLRPLVAQQNLSFNMLRSIATYRLLHSQGLATAWVCGTSKTGDGAPEEEYAWLEMDGFPLAIWPGDAKRRVYAERARIPLPAELAANKEN